MKWWRERAITRPTAQRERRATTSAPPSGASLFEACSLLSRADGAAPRFRPPAQILASSGQVCLYKMSVDDQQWVSCRLPPTAAALQRNRLHSHWDSHSGCSIRPVIRTSKTHTHPLTLTATEEHRGVDVSDQAPLVAALQNGGPQQAHHGCAGWLIDCLHTHAASMGGRGACPCSCMQLQQ